MIFFDSHCHFDFIEFNADRAAIWQACKAQNIHHLLMPGVCPDQWQVAAQLCAQYTGLVYAAGVHPHWIERQEWLTYETTGLFTAATQEKLIALMIAEVEQTQLNGSSTSVASKCVAIGECGLDKLIGTPIEQQQQLLNLHIHVANQLNKPLIVHCVRAHNEMIALLKKNKPNAGGVVHAFSGSYEVAQEYVGLGFYLGVGGTITYERAQKTRAAVAQIPLENLLLETDAPDMPLQGKQGERNSPEYLPIVAQVLAELRGVTVDEIATATSRNALNLFHCG